jgi:hypothetical protein
MAVRDDVLTATPLSLAGIRPAYRRKRRRITGYLLGGRLLHKMRRDFDE